MSRQILLRFVLGVLGLSALVSAADFSFSRPRPLMALCAQLQNKYGLLVTYEDSPYDPSELSSEIIPRNGVKAFTPKWKPITFHVLSELPTRSEVTSLLKAPPDSNQALTTVQDLVNQYNQSGNPGQFSVTQNGRYLHIQQTMRMEDGRMQPFDPISNTLLAWQPRDENCYAMLGYLSAALSQARGFSLAEGNLPASMMMYRCSIGGNSVTVEQVLEAIIAGLGTNLATGKKATHPSYAYAWDLVYDPNWNKYFLSLNSVHLNTPASAQPAHPPKVTTPSSSSGPGRLGHRTTLQAQH